MWSHLEKTVNNAVKKVQENEQFQEVARKVEKQTKKVTIKVQEKFKAKDKADDNDDHEAKDNKTRYSKPFCKVQAAANGEGDMSEILWEDGSCKRMPSLRVFGKDTTIVVADDIKNCKSKTNEDASVVVEEAERGLALSTATATSTPLQPDFNPKVKLPVLIFPGMCSSGLYIQNSGLDNPKYQGRRLWMNAAFLAQSANPIGKKIVSSSRTVDPSNHTAYVDDETSHNNSFFNNVEHLDRDDASNDASNDALKHNTTIQESALSMGHAEMNVEFAKMEEELNIRSSWLYHVSLDKNMVDERPGNRVRTYDGIKACEWLVDDAVSKPMAVVWADMIQFMEKEMGYIRGKNLDAAPYDWRLPPMTVEHRDGYLTKTIQRVETMYQDSGGLPIVMCCHSMGCRMGHYFLNFCLREKGREWIDKHIHTYMPIGAPHCGAPLTARLGATGSGLIGFTEDLMITPDEGVIMYRSWGSGSWLMPRDLPSWTFPSCIVRREGELGIKIASEINVGSLFADRAKPPRELRLTLVFRDKVRASTEFVPLTIDKEMSPPSMILSFDETFYLAVPDLPPGDDDVGSLVFFLEEPSGGLYRDHGSKIRTQFQNATKWARGFKKEFTKFYRNVSKKIGAVVQVAVCEKPLEVKASAFADASSTTATGTPVIEAVMPFCKCECSADANKILNDDNDESDSEDEGENDTLNASKRPARRLTCYNFDNPFEEKPIGSLSINLKYSPPPNFQTDPSPRTAKFAMVAENTPSPPIVNKKKKSAVYEAWHGTDLLDKDGFCGGMFDVNEEYYEQDPLGPTTKSALEAPPVNIVRSIYGINVPTEVGAIYRKEPVVIIGDNKADYRYCVDKSAHFAKFDDSSKASDDQEQPVDPRIEAMTKGHRISKGLIEELPEALQQVPGTTEKRRCCGDGTVPYWSLVHCLNWKDSIPTLSVDELEGAVHRTIISSSRFHALLQQYVTVDDPRAPLAIMSNSSANDTTLATIEQRVVRLEPYV